MVPISMKPKPGGKAVDVVAVLSRPAASPTGLGNCSPMTSTGHGATGLTSSPGQARGVQQGDAAHADAVGGFGVEGEEELRIRE